MAVQSKFSDQVLTQILADYHLGTYIDSSPLTEGSVQTNIKINTTEGPVVFRYYENRHKDSVAFEVQLLEFLHSKNFPCARPYKNKCGHYIGIHRDKPYVIFEYIEGEHIENPNEMQM